MDNAKILIVEDSPSLALGYAAQLEDAGHEVTLSEELAEARKALASREFDTVLLDLQLPDGDGLTIFDDLKNAVGFPSVVVVTADGSLSRAIAAMRLGAYDFLVKPVSGTRLLTTVSRAADQGGKSDTAPSNKKAKSSFGGNGNFHGFIGKSPQMQSIYETIDSIADSKATIFVTGESGTGKEVTAEAIHASSRRAKGPFVAINCGAIPENLLESELFGHVKGAFTGAVENRIGAAKAADGGTLFLDEICEMDIKLQVKLLRFLQTEMIQRVGSSAAEPVDVRIICATNRDPQLEVTAGRFREDLFYRLNVIPITLPPLRDRGDDVVLIAHELAARIAKEEGKEPRGFTATSEAFLTQHSWPGNVRELQNSLRRAIVTSTGKQIELSKVAPQAMGGSTPMQAPAELPEARPVVLPVGTSPQHATVETTVDFTGMTLSQVERMAIEQAISRSSGNICQAARQLDVSPSTIYRKLERWDAA